MKQILPITLLVILVSSVAFTHEDHGNKQGFTPHSGKFILSFDFAARQGVQFNSSTFTVTWNNKEIQRYTPINYNIISFKNAVEARVGNNFLSFAGTGVSDSLGGAVTDIKLTRVTICGPEDAIVNGAFDTGNTVGAGWQIFKSTIGWTATNGIQIGAGRVYNAKWPIGKHVAELDTNQNTIITQIIKLDQLNRVVKTV